MDKTEFEKTALQTPVDPVIEEMKTRWGRRIRCAECFHAYETVIGINQTGLVCMQSPPQFQAMQQRQGIAVQMVPRLVQADLFCHQYKDKVAAV